MGHRPDYDSPWKGMLERYFRDFTALFFPRAQEEIDWSRGYTFLDKELRQVARDAKLGRRVTDKLVRVARTDGSPAGVLIQNVAWKRFRIRGAEQWAKEKDIQDACGKA